VKVTMKRARAPLFFHLREDTYLRGFVYAALTAAVTTAVVLEYRIINPFDTYASEENVSALSQQPRPGAMLQTCAVAFVSTMFSLVTLHIFFACGDSMVVGS